VKKQTVFYIVSALVALNIITAIVCIYQAQVAVSKAGQAQFTAQETKKSQDLIDLTRANGLTYSGKDGKTALELLEQNAKIKTNGTGTNAFITSINGVTANSSNQYWAFYINGESSTVGAGSYTTKSTDTISWKLESF